MRNKHWTREEILSRLRELHQQGVKLVPSEMQRREPRLFYIARSKSYFGTWRQAVAAAGLSYQRIKRSASRWSPERVKRDLARHFEVGEDLLSKAFRKQHPKLIEVARSKSTFGGWRQALEAAGLDPEEVRKRHFLSAERLIEELQSMAERGEAVTSRAVRQSRPELYRAARRPETFGSFQAALVAAGLAQEKPKQRIRWSRDLIVRGIQLLARRGVGLSQQQALAIAPALVAAAKSRRYFGSWGKAVEAAGFDYAKHTQRRRKGTRGRRGEAR